MPLEELEHIIDISFDIIYARYYKLVDRQSILFICCDLNLLSTIIFHCNCEDEYKKIEYYERVMDLYKMFFEMK